ncbi:MAG: D-alanine--D-alanine ligase [Myxococcales bacterium]|nr:D-alanine--D-alanine ligase [Myxococcales bacterium]
MSAREALRVAVVSGGPSSEANVSRASAATIEAALRASGHAVTPIELDARTAEGLREGAFDVVFPITHGAFGEDGCLQGVMEVCGVPYVGANVLASALAMSKPMAKLAFAAAGLPLARGLVVRREDGPAALVAERALREVGSRLVVKPAANGSAIGVARIDEGGTVADVARAIEGALAVDSAALVEHFAKGREVTCGVLDLHPDVRRLAKVGPIADADGPFAFPPTEIVAPGDAFYTYEARYAPGRSHHVCPAALPPHVLESVRDVARRAHLALGVRDLCRVDFVVGDVAAPDAITLLEVNTLPGFTATSLFPEAAGVAGLSLPTLCDLLVRSAHARGPTPRNDARALPT